MSTVYVTRRARFNAAHRLHNADKSDTWNQATFGACNSPNWHGHNYILDITIAGEPDPETGYVLDLALLSHLIEDHVVRHLDHKNLNLDVPFIHDIIPSTENLVIAIWDRLVNVLPAGRLHRVYLEETEKNSAEYFGPDS